MNQRRKEEIEAEKAKSRNKRISSTHMTPASIRMRVRLKIQILKP